VAPPADPASLTSRLVRRALHRAGPRLVEATLRARADQLADRAALAAWARAYGHDLLVFHRVDLDVRCALLDPRTGDELRRTMTVEHDELAGAAREAERALEGWAVGTADGRGALAAVRAQLDDLVVHDAHEIAAVARALEVVPGRSGGSSGSSGSDDVVDALLRAPLTDPPFLGPLTLADADPLERHALLATLPPPLLARWTGAEAAHAETTRRAMGA